MNIFVPSSLPTLRARPLEQFWRDHLLACSLLLDRASGYDHGAFVVLYPNGNKIVESAVTRYRSCLLEATTFMSWTLEQVFNALGQGGAGSWATEVRERYLGS